MTTRYRRTVSAALAETQSKFELAEALARDIPYRRQGGSTEDEKSITQEVGEARQEIIDAGGEPRSVKTLTTYRETALWAQSSPGNAGTFRWLEGASFSAHVEARHAGLTYRQFTQLPSTKLRDIRPDKQDIPLRGDPAQTIQSWTPEQQAEAARELMSDPEVADAAMRDLRARNRAAQAISQHHERTREHVERGPGAPLREKMDTRIEVQQVGMDLIRVRQSIGRLSALGRIQPLEMEILADEAQQTLPAVQWVADLSPDKADIGDQAAAFLRSLS